MPQYEHWLLEEEPPIVTMTLNRPEHENSMQFRTLHEMREVAAYLETRRDLWVVIVQGAGKHFSAGMDLVEIEGQLGEPAAATRAFISGMQRNFDAFEALNKPTIAKVRGFCMGGGMVLALCCDFRIASQRCVFSLPEVKVGLGVVAGTDRVTRLVGVAAAKELILLGKRVRAKEALAIGLVNKLVPPAELDSSVAAFAKRFLTLPPRTVGAAKQMINQGQDLPLRESQDLEIDIQAELFGSPDLQEAIASYREKRRPRFSGQ